MNEIMLFIQFTLCASGFMRCSEGMLSRCAEICRDMGTLFFFFHCAKKRNLVCGKHEAIFYACMKMNSVHCVMINVGSVCWCFQQNEDTNVTNVIYWPFLSFVTVIFFRLFLFWVFLWAKYCPQKIVRNHLMSIE